jgi:glutamate/tyrosine decarboxylase-like PLP-dependent enzyme
LLIRVFADHLQEAVSAPTIGEVPADQTRANESFEVVNEPVIRSVSAYVRDGAKVCTVFEHAEAAKQALLGVAEQTMTPRDRGPQTAMSVGCVTRAVCEQIQGSVEMRNNLVRDEDANARGVKYKSQSHADQAHTEHHDNRDVDLIH